MNPVINPTAPRTRKIIEQLRNDVEQALSCRLFLEHGNTVSAEAAFASLGKRSAILVRYAIEQRLVMILMQMHDAGFSRGRKNDRDCLEHVFEDLKDPSLRGSITRPGGEARIDQAISLWQHLDVDRQKRLRNLRDYKLAHTISEKHGFNQPSYDDLLALARETETMVEALADGTGIYTVSLQEVAIQLITPDIENYWSRLERV